MPARRSRWPIVAAAVGLLPVLYWWSLGPVTYVRYRFTGYYWMRPSVASQLLDSYAIPSNWVAARWPWYYLRTEVRVTEWGWLGYRDKGYGDSSQLAP